MENICQRVFLCVARVSEQNQLFPIFMYFVPLFLSIFLYSINAVLKTHFVDEAESIYRFDYNIDLCRERIETRFFDINQKL